MSCGNPDAHDASGNGKVRYLPVHDGDGIVNVGPSGKMAQ